MPKIIAPKRTNKSVTVEDYWAIRQNFSKIKQKPITSYKEKQVEKRHRFVKLKEQIRVFNPLQYFITKDQNFSSEDKTHTHAYLQTIYYRLPEEIMQVKRYMFGLASILKNLQKIYGIIWQHLSTDDAWKIVQTLLRDTRQQSYQLWISKGLQKVVQGVTTQFKQSRFRQIFFTLCLFMEVCFPRISQSQQSVSTFLQKMGEFYFGNKNKYIRKFSIRLVSYVMANIQEQLFHKVILRIISNQQDNKIKPYIPDILSQRLKHSDRCLTPNSLQQLINIINWLNQIKVNDQIMTNFIYKVFTNLQQKKQQNQTLFDFCYIVKAVVQLSQNKKIHPSCVIAGIAMYLQQDIKQKYEKKRRLNEDILLIVSHFLWENLPQLQQNQSVYHLFALSFHLPLQNMGKIKDYLSKCQDEQLILNFLSVGGQNTKKQTSMLLIVSFKKIIQSFFNHPIIQNNQTRIQIIYKLFFMLKQNSIKLNLSKLFEGNTTDPTNTLNQLIKTYRSDLQQGQKQLIYQYTLVFLRFLTVIQVSPSIVANLTLLLGLSLDNYYSLLKIYLSSTRQRDESIFKCNNYSQQIFLYSHSSIPIVWQGFNILQSFIQVQKSLNQKIIDRNAQNYKLWHKIVINRPSNCNQIQQVLHKSGQSYLYVLQSRHRVIRLMTIEHLQNLQLFKQCQQLALMIHEIQQEDVDLDNERNVKRMFLDMLRFIQQTQLSLEVNKALLSWCIGFAFTGFKLIQESFATFMAGLLESQQNIDFTALLRFLQYYTFKNSRIYKQETRKFFEQLQYQALQLPNSFVELINKDFSHQELQTVQFIGVDRVTLAISKSQKLKKRIENRLMNIINQYFNEQFVRYKSTLSQNEDIIYKSQSGQINQLLLPPKTTFLKQILKIVPEDYLPPLQCLHYTNQFLKLQSVHKIKRQQWQLMWNKKTKMQHNRIKFQNMSLRQMQVYIHFLWGEMLKADANRLRIIVEHIRDYMNHKVNYLMDIFFQELTFGADGSQKIKNIFRGMDSRKLLTFMYIMKTIIKTLKNYVRQNFNKIVQILVNIAEVVDVSNKIYGSQQMNIEQPAENALKQQDQQEEVHEQDQDEIQQQRTQKNQMKKYKNHRKEVFKIFNELIKILGDQIAIEDIDHVLSVFQQQNKLKALGKNSIHSTPGLLLFIKQISDWKKFHSLLIKYQITKQICEVLINGYNAESNGSVSVCIHIVNNILGIHRQNQMIDQAVQSTQIQNAVCEEILSSVFVYLDSANKIKSDLEFGLLHITLQLMGKCKNLERKWQKYLLHALTQIVNLKSMSQSNKNKLTLLIQISMKYSSKSQTSQFLISLLSLIPQLKQLQHRKLIVKALSGDVALGKEKAIGKQSVDIVMKLNSTIDGGLVQQINFSDFFDGVNLYKEKLTTFSIQQQQFIIYNLLAYLSSPELSVRKSVSSCLQLFLTNITVNHKQIVIKLLRIICEQMRKPNNFQDQIFWSIFSCIGHFVKWIIQNDYQNSQNYAYFSKYIKSEDTAESENIFDNLCAIAQKQKLNGLKSMKTMLSGQQINMSNKMGQKYPNILTHIFLPVLQHFILPQTSNINNKFGQVVGNLTSSLSHVSLQIYELVMRKGGQSMQKKQLKRLISKLKFDEMNIKKNILIIKIIGQIVESISLPKVTQSIHKIISQEGVQDFHRKMLQKSGKTSKIKQDDDDDQQQQQLRKRIAFNGINNQIDDQQLINIGYMNLDKKLIQAEEIQKGDTQETSTARFLRVHVLTPLKTMLMFQNRSQKNSKQQSDKSRMLLSVVVTKIILKFPVDVFMSQLQKILSKLAKLLKKKEVQIRQHARTCLAEIAKLVGTDLFYLIFRELKFHLRDNFQHHVLNYTIYNLLEKFGHIQNGALDNCLPLLLPPIIDEIFGKASTQKQMVQQNLIPTINMQSRKRKSNDLLTIICKQISMSKIQYLVKYFQKFLLQFMNSQANVNKYEQMLTNIIGGLNRNDKVMTVQNSSQFIQILHTSIEKLKSQIKLYKFQQVGLKHESTVNQAHGIGKKAGKEVMQIQEQAGRNASIFKKKAKEIQQRRNHQVLTGCFMQFHLAILALLIKKKIINSEQHSDKFQSIITFIVECIDHRDNRIVHKCLKVIHNVIQWKKMPNIMQIRKKTSRKIFNLIQKLTSADEDLLRQCFTLLNDLFEQVNINVEVLHILLAIIKLHITTIQRTIAQQPFKLLKTVLIKISQDPTLLYDPAVYQLYQFVRITLISTTLDHIRNICRQICCLYIKQTKPPSQTKKKPKSSPAIDYNKQISLYLNNLDCKYSQTQLAVLEVIKTYIIWHSKQEIQETGEVIIMAMGTAYANDADNQQKINQIIRAVVEKIDNSKTLGLLDKCIIWAQNQQNQLISVCGFFILQNIIQSKAASINNQRRTQISGICGKILSKQYDNVAIYQLDIKQKIHQAQTVRSNPQWKNIIQEQDVYLKIEKNFKSCTNILNILFNLNKKLQNNHVLLLWKLISAPSEMINSRVGSLLAKINSISTVVGEKILSLNQQQQDSLKNKIALIVKNLISNQNMQYGCIIAKKVLQQLKDVDNIHEIVQAIIFVLLNRISKSILNLKKNERSMKMAYDFIQTILTVDEQICKKVLKNEKLLGQIFWNIAKVSRNQLIDNSIKEKNDQLSQIIKNNISQAEFYRRLASVQADRKQKRAEEKSQLLKLAIVDQQAYGLAKAKKKHKKG